MAASLASRRTASQLELEVDLWRPCFSTVPRSASQRTASVLIADEPRTRGRKATLGGSRLRLRSRGGVAPERFLGSPWRSSSPIYQRSRPQRPKNQISFFGAKDRRSFHFKMAVDCPPTLGTLDPNICKKYSCTSCTVKVYLDWSGLYSHFHKRPPIIVNSLKELPYKKNKNILCSKNCVIDGKVAKSPRDKITHKTKSPTVMKKDKITHLEITQGQDHPKDQITQKTKSPKRPNHPLQCKKTKSPT